MAPKTNAPPPSGSALWTTPIGPVRGLFSDWGWTALALPAAEQSQLPVRDQALASPVTLEQEEAPEAEPGPAAAGSPDPAIAAGLVEAMTRFLSDYFSGIIPVRPLLDLRRLTPFQESVSRALLKVPCGQAVTYEQLARMAGRPHGARAVGQTMARNPLPLVIPCHRVLASGGRLGGYGPGPALKQWLLDWEAAMTKQNALRNSGAS
jgi:methylated-DNA-[protein]-cysteine S-methyltransferase